MAAGSSQEQPGALLRQDRSLLLRQELSQQQSSVLSQQQTPVLPQQQTLVLSPQPTSVLSQQKSPCCLNRRHLAALGSSWGYENDFDPFFTSSMRKMENAGTEHGDHGEHGAPEMQPHTAARGQVLHGLGTRIT